MMEQSGELPDGRRTAGHHSTWWVDAPLLFHDLPPLNENITADVVIVGAGLAGMTIAYCLAKSGKMVVVVDDGLIGSGETGRTTAQMVTALEDRYYNMEKVFGADNNRLIAQSHLAAIDFVEQVVKTENIDCEFQRVDGYLFLHTSDKPESLQKELEAGNKCGLQLTPVDVIPGLPYENGGLHFPGQAQFHPMKYLAGLSRVISQHGGRIYTNTHADEFDSKGIRVAGGFRIDAEHIVVATNAPVNDKYAMMLKQWAYRSYVSCFPVKKGLLPHAFWWDTGDQDKEASAYHYVRLAPYTDTHDLLIAGGEDHIAGKTEDINVPEEDRYKLLEDWTRQRFPVKDVVQRWSGEVLVPMDTIAFIGRNPWDRDNVYICTGDSGIGMTYCTIAGMLISDLINGKENPWEKIYDPRRFTFSSSRPFFRMLKGDLVEVLKKWFYTGAVELEEIAPGEAKIVKINRDKCGAYRDEKGQLHIVSAECTHLKCMVSWNADEKSWDCPCHGSRFSYTGKVLNGPANVDLPAYSEKGKISD